MLNCPEGGGAKIKEPPSLPFACCSVMFDSFACVCGSWCVVVCGACVCCCYSVLVVPCHGRVCGGVVLPCACRGEAILIP